MSEFKLKKVIGNQEIMITETFENHADLIAKLAFFSQLPSVGPNGEKDLKFEYRVTPKEGYKYYSLISEQAGQEFDLGQSQKKSGTLYAKGWIPLHNRSGSETPSQNSAPKQNPKRVVKKSLPNPSPKKSTATPRVRLQNSNVAPKKVVKKPNPNPATKPPKTSRTAEEILAEFASNVG